MTTYLMHLLRPAVCLAICLAVYAPAQAQLYFPPIGSDTWDTLSPRSLNWCEERIDSLYAFLETNNTRAFILLKDGKIVLERYFGSHTAASNWYWASAGKTLTAFMVGMAQQEQYLSIEDTTARYLGAGWTACTPPQEEAITIWHQLTMTSGLSDGVADPFCTLDSCLVYLADPGTRWAYHNGPYTLLDGVIEAATGQTLNTYTTQKLKTPTGMTGLYVQQGYNNVFFSNARSMARFGLLMLNRGIWDGQPVMTDTAYFDQMTQPSQALNPAYGYLWWLNGQDRYMVPQTQFVFPGMLNPHAPADMYAAMGKNGQFLNVVPSEGLVWVRMGDAPDNALVPFLLNDQIWAYLGDLACDALAIDPTIDAVALYPNPTTATLTVALPEGGSLSVMTVDLCDLRGRCLQTLRPDRSRVSLDLGALPPGIYFVRIREGDRLLVRKVIRE
ncbi:MAG: hypothetical protein OHK0039_09260 [Bacteroidia bacterium]